MLIPLPTHDTSMPYSVFLDMYMVSKYKKLAIKCVECFLFDRSSYDKIILDIFGRSL